MEVVCGEGGKQVQSSFMAHGMREIIYSFMNTR